MSAFVVSEAHINAMVTAADRDAAKYNSQYRFYPNDENLPRYIELSRTQTEDMIALEGGGVIYSLEAFGRLLLDECKRSVSYRYDESMDSTELPGVIAEQGPDFSYRYHSIYVEAIQALKAIRCYQYQSCEHPTWLNSIAKSFCDALTHSLIDELPGYEEAAWEIEDNRTHSVERS